MQQITIEQFFSGKHFRIPPYQRDYAWDVSPNIDDLFQDIMESIDLRKLTQSGSSANHYLGTFILCKKENELYSVVDGQQRLTTLTMILNAAIDNLTPNEQVINRDKFIISNNKNRLELSSVNNNNIFFKALLDGNSPNIFNRSQRLLKIAYDEIQRRVVDIANNTNISLQELLDSIKYCEVLEFIEIDESKAIRIFQTVNDRGKPLTNMEKTKSLLIYYSSKFLSGSLDDWINNKFGEIFRLYDNIKELSEKNGITPINTKDFNEDGIMRYHFLAYKNDNISDKYDYYASLNYILETFLKQTLKELKSNSTSLNDFINDYVTDLYLFFESLLEIVTKADTQEKYYKLFSILKLSATLLPLAVRLQSINLIDQSLSGSQNATFLDLLETAEIRIYKVKGSEPIKDVSYLAKDAKGLTPQQIESRFTGIISWFLNDADFKSRLNGYVFDKKTFLRRFFIEYDESLLGKKYSLSELKFRNNLPPNNKPPTIDHIFAQKPTFPYISRGFQTEEEYCDIIHTLGNLALIDGSLNSSFQNKPPEDKISDPRYVTIPFESTIRIATSIKNKGSSFSKVDINNRTSTLSIFCVRAWKV